ncbi:hypothetical protein ACSSS7_004545 [Eimeria intestinalis]
MTLSSGDGLGRNHGRSLTGERVQSSNVATRGIPRTSRSALMHSYVEGAGRARGRGAPRASGSVRQTRGELGGSHGSGLIQSARGSLLQNPVPIQLPLNAPRGTSPFAAASAARVALLQAAGLGYPATTGPEDAALSPLSGSRATRGRPQNAVDVFAHPQPLRSHFSSSGHSRRQRSQRALTAEFFSGRDSSEFAHFPESSRPASVWGQTPGFSGVQSRGGYPEGVNRRMNNSRAEGATHSNRSGPRGPCLFSPVDGPPISFANSRGTDGEFGNASIRGSSGDGQEMLFNNFLSQGVATRVHRGFYPGLWPFSASVASPVSASHRGSGTAVVSPIFASVEGPAREAQVSSRGTPASPDEFQGQFRRVFVGLNPTFIVCRSLNSGARSARAVARELGSFLDELDSAFGISSLEGFEAPLRRVLLGGDVLNASDDLMQFLVGADETPVPLSQIAEARDLFTSLERHATRWTFGSAESELSRMGGRQADSSTQATSSSSRNAADSAGGATACEEPTSPAWA